MKNIIIESGWWGDTAERTSEKSAVKKRDSPYGRPRDIQNEGLPEEENGGENEKCQGFLVYCLPLGPTTPHTGMKQVDKLGEESLPGKRVISGCFYFGLFEKSLGVKPASLLPLANEGFLLPTHSCNNTPCQLLYCFTFQRSIRHLRKPATCKREKRKNWHQRKQIVQRREGFLKSLFYILGEIQDLIPSITTECM